MEDKQFANHFMIILAVLVSLTALILIIAIYLSSTHKEIDISMRNSMEKNISPIGKVNIGAIAMEKSIVSSPFIKTIATSAMNAEKTYATACAACHSAGVAGAPVLGDKSAWNLRLSKGVETLYNSSLQGLGVMPPKGGRPDLSDETIKQAVDYMLEAVQ